MNDTAVKPTRVWDVPTRVFHALLIACFAGAWITGDSERWRVLHVTLGLTMAGLIAWRVIWGLVGTRHARFADFVRGPGKVVGYLKSLVTRRPEHHVGHNPAGGWAVLALLGLTAVTTGLGWAAYSEWGGEWLGELHEGTATAMLVLVAVHVAGVLLSSRLHRENLVGAMITGRKRIDTGESDVRPWRTLAVLMLVAVVGFWAVQWQQAPNGGAVASARGERGHGIDKDDDD
jgi:cytochrome b